jgi:hypothetical protein
MKTATLFPPIFFKKVALSFIRAFLAAFVTGLAGVLAAPNWGAGKAALVAVSIAAVTAGIRAIQAIFTDLEPTS